MYSSRLYTSSPVWLQERLISASSLARNVWRQGSLFRTALAEIETTQWWSLPQLEEYQLRRVRELLAHAARHVPYYRRLFETNGFDPTRVASLSDLARLPVLKKKDVIAAGHDLVATDLRPLKIRGTTSGTTGTYLTGFRDRTSASRENAFLWRQLSWAGLESGQRRAWLRGDQIAPLRQAKLPFWRRNRADNMLMLSSFHLSERTSGSYVEALEQFNPVVIQAYPAAIAFLGRHLVDTGRRYGGSALRGIVTSSESLGDEQRRLIQEAFGVRVFDWYGSFERTAAIGTCERGTYHLLSDYSYVELLPEDDGSAEIVGTGFDNYVMPLVRYRSVDSVVPADPSRSCPCGRRFPILERVLGRIDEQIKTADGRHIVLPDWVFYGVDTLAEAQVVQDRLDHVILVVVPRPGFGPKDAEALRRNARERFGDGFTVDVEVVGHIPRTAAGKFRSTICRV
jgi:phenylacetate-CoA ligase